MKIGEKDYTAKITNRVIWEIEEAFNDVPIAKVMRDIEGFTLKQMGVLIWHSIKDEISFEEFADSINVSQYASAAVEVGNELAKAFDTGSKKVEADSKNEGEWDWYEVQKLVYGAGLLKPKEFWDLQPKDIIIMAEGFREQQEYKDSLHCETLSLLRYIGYTSYIGIPTKKGVKKSKPEKYYPLRKDKKQSTVYDSEFISKFFKEKQPYITNGKLRGYIDRWGNLEKIN